MEKQLPEQSNSSSPGKADDRLTPQILVFGEVQAPLSLWQELQRSSNAEPWLLGHTALDLLSTWAHLQRFLPASIDQTVWEGLDALVHSDATQLVASVALLRPLSGFDQRAISLEREWEAIAGNDTEPLADALSELFYLLDNSSLALAACDTLARGSHCTGLPSLMAFRGDVESAEEYFADNTKLFMCAARWASWMFGAYRPDLDAIPWLWQATLKYRRLEDAYESFHASPPLPIRLPIREMADWLETERIEAAYLQSLGQTDEQQPITLRPVTVGGRARVDLFEALPEYQRDYELSIAAGGEEKDRESAVFPASGFDVPQVVVWRAANPMEDAIRPAGALAEWSAFFNGRFFLFVKVPPAEMKHWSEAKVSWIPNVPHSAGRAVECRRVGVGRHGRAWSFLTLLEPPIDADLCIYATPRDQAADLAESDGTVEVELGGISARSAVPSCADAARIWAQVPAIWSISQDIADRPRSIAARAALIQILVNHTYRSRSPVSDTLAFYAYWIAQVHGLEGAVLDFASARHLLAGFSQSSGWPKAFSERMSMLLKGKGGDGTCAT